MRDELAEPGADYQPEFSQCTHVCANTCTHAHLASWIDHIELDKNAEMADSASRSCIRIRDSRDVSRSAGTARQSFGAALTISGAADGCNPS